MTSQGAGGLGLDGVGGAVAVVGPSSGVAVDAGRLEHGVRCLSLSHHGGFGIELIVVRLVCFGG